jgi:hypothetical protein
VDPHHFWDYTLFEISCINQRGKRVDEANWMRTSSQMALFAQANSKRGRTFSPADFNPYLAKSRGNEYGISSRDDVLKLAEKFKKL